MRTKIVLECARCKSRNYVATKNKQSHPGRVERQKFCRQCGTHRLHRETR